MQLKVATDADAAARLAAAEIARVCSDAVAARGQALVAVSGGATPWLMLQAMSALDLPWSGIHIAQVDERVAPEGDTQRNLTRLQQILVRDGPLPATRLLRMPVDTGDLVAAAAAYQHTLEAIGGAPLVFDLVQLGLGTDGHTASLVPDDPVLDVFDRDVAVTGVYQGLRRMTLTLPAINRAAHRLWLVTGAAKTARLRELTGETAVTPRSDSTGRPDDATAPSLRVTRNMTVVVADEAALRLRGGPFPG